MEKKVRFHLHKVKKHWVTLMVSAVTLGLLLVSGSQVSADEVVATNAASSAEEIVITDTGPETSTSPVAIEQTEADQAVVEAGGNSGETTLTNQEKPVNDLAVPAETVVAETSVEETIVATDQVSPDTNTITDTTTDPGQTQPVTVETTPEGSDHSTSSVDTPRNQFVSDDQGNWYYYDADGQKMTGFHVVDSFPLYFYPDGVQAKDAFIKLDASTYYFKPASGQLAMDGFFSDSDGNWYYADPTGQILTGAQTIDTFNLYFYEDGVQAKDALIERDGKTYYYDKDNGRLVTNQTFTFDGKTYTADGEGVVTETPQYRNQFVSDEAGNWYYYDANGQKLTGFQTVDYVRLYFHEDGRQAKGELVTVDGKKYYFDQKTGELYRHVYPFEIDGVTYTANADGVLTEVPKYRNQFVSDNQGNWYYVDDAGHLLIGAQTIDTFKLYFYEDGVQAKDALIERDGKTYYYDKDNGRLVTNQIFTFAGKTYTADADGVATEVRA